MDERSGRIGFVKPKAIPIISKRRGWANTIGFLAIFLAAFNLIFWSFLSVVSVKQSDATCDLQTSNGLERALSIDIQVAPSLQFFQAKAIDIAWDLVMGQCGRVFHAWLLYKYVIMKVFPHLMKDISVSWSFYVNINFHTISVWTLASLVRAIYSSRVMKFSVLAFVILLDVAYMLLFPTLWSAATGYVAVSRNLLRMPDGELVGPGSTQLCFVVNSTRLDNNASSLLVGPFMKQVLQETNSAVAWPNLYPGGAESELDGEISAQYLTSNDTTDDLANYLKYMAVADILAKILENYGDEKRPAEISRYFSFPLSMENDIETMGFWMWEQLIGDQVLIRNNSLGPEFYLPFNSTINFKGAPHRLSAPFLTAPDRTKGPPCPMGVGLAYPDRDISTTFIRPPNGCLCYQNQIIEYPLVAEHLECVATDSYTWGFSNTLLGVCMGLEFFFMFNCFIIAFCMIIKPNKDAKTRASSGPIRVALDLVGAIGAELGPDTYNHSESQLEKVLDTRGGVAFDVLSDCDPRRMLLVPHDYVGPRRRQHAGTSIGSASDKGREDDEQAFLSTQPSQQDYETRDLSQGIELDQRSLSRSSSEREPTESIGVLR